MRERLGWHELDLATLQTTKLPIRCRVPPPEEQQRITAYSRSPMTTLRGIVRCDCARSAELLREYRTRLIADVVTGKLDVREAAGAAAGRGRRAGAARRVRRRAESTSRSRRAGGGRGMTTDTSERGLEELIVRTMTGHIDAVALHVAHRDLRSGRRRHRLAARRPAGTTTATTASTSSSCVASSTATQPRTSSTRSRSAPTARRAGSSSPGSRARSPSAASSTCCGNGIKHGPHHVDLFYGTPSPGNAKAVELFARNRFSVTRQLRYSTDETQLALDLGLFINGLPVATFELKNSLTKQTVDDAVEQYKRDRDPRELLFEFGRCVVHFAVDDAGGAVLHAPEGQGVVVPAVQPGLERRRRQPAEPGRPQDRLPLEADPDAARAHRHPRELRAGRRRQGREDRQEAARRRSSRATTSSTSSGSCSPTPASTAPGGAT